MCYTCNRAVGTPSANGLVAPSGKCGGQVTTLYLLYMAHPAHTNATMPIRMRIHGDIIGFFLSLAVVGYVVQETSC